MKKRDATSSKSYSKFGIASLPVILLLGGIIIEIGIASTFLLVYLNNSIYGIRLSNEALEGAHSGINDAVMRVILDKNFNEAYDLTVGRASVDISVCKDVCVANRHEVTAIGRAFTKQHKLVAILNVSSTTGFVEIESIVEDAN